MQQNVELAECDKRMLPIRDALDVISGKWKMMILLSIMNGHHRFGEIERSLMKISSKVLAKELKDLEEHKLITRKVEEGRPISISYALTPYADSLQPVIQVLHDWGMNHRKVILGK